jgi:hypothetical protein
MSMSQASAFCEHQRTRRRSHLEHDVRPENSLRALFASSRPHKSFVTMFSTKLFARSKERFSRFSLFVRSRAKVSRAFVAAITASLCFSHFGSHTNRFARTRV